jgi:acetyl esterase/lipase
MAALTTILAFLAAGASALAFFRFRALASALLWLPKALAQSAAAFVAGLGALAAALGWLSRAPLAVAAGLLGTLLSVRTIVRTAAPHEGFAQAFGPDWQRRIGPEQQARLLKHRFVGRLPSPPGVRWERNLPFWTIPGTDRSLRCDLWQPPAGVRPSGLAFVYFHGGAWHWLDKDVGTRPFFCHLAAQGHLVMDVAYRLCPEVDVSGMVGDAKRAIVWIKAHGASYGVDPTRVVVAGGSSGGHLALLAAYAPTHPALTPADIGDADPSVRAVVAYYSATDMAEFYRHFAATFGSLAQGYQPGEGGIVLRATSALTGWVMGDAVRRTYLPEISIDWMMGNLLGGTPDEVPAMYELASPISHAGPGSPPTLLLQGEHDAFQPARLTRALHRKLIEAGVPSVYVELPQSEHGFDLLLPRYAPAAQAALYDVERFLALMV